jgi:NAD-specific glutamate dehydrogenase
MEQGKADVLDALTTLDSSLTEWLLLATPSTDAEKAEVEDVRALRTRLQHHMNEILRHRRKLAMAGMKDHAARLTAITERIKKAAKTMATVKEVAGVVGEAVSIAGAVAGALAG